MRIRHRSQNGFSLIEVMIAILIFTVGIAGVTSSLWYGTHASQHGKRITEATNHARSMMEALRGRNYIENAIPMVSGWPGPTSGLNDAPGDRVPLDTAPFLQAHLHNADLRSFTRNVTVTRASTNTSDHEYGLAVVTIRVYWMEKDSERHIEVRGVISHGL